jgi:SPP1 family predicted phage head-tail adaptor
MKVPILNRRLVLEARERVPDGAGGFVETWQALGTLWGEVDTRSGRDDTAAEIALGHVGLRIRVRAAPVGAPSRPLPGQRFREGARIYRILAVSEADARARYLVCFAREEVAA